MLKEQFIGTWRLVAYEYQRSDGERIYPFGDDPVGILIYSADGFMSAQISRRERQDFASGNRWNGTTEEMAQAYKDYLAYFGTYQIKQSESEIEHTVEGSLFPDYLGSVQLRCFEHSAGHLILRTPPMPAGAHTVTGQLVWSRAA